LDAVITELDKEKRKISLSIKALEEKQTKEAVKKYGSKDSGGVLGEILGPLLSKKSKKKK
jgi:small subunit ribosomal protein S1